MAEPLTSDLALSGEGPPWLTPGVRGIGAASLLADLGHEIPTALLPSLLTSTLGAPASALGLIEGVSDAPGGCDAVRGRAAGDDPQRRRSTAVGGYAGTAILSGLVGVATSVWQVGLLRAGAWAARGIRVPVAERPPRRRGHTGHVRAGLRLRAGDGQPRGDRRAAARPCSDRGVQREDGDPAFDHPRPARGAGDHLRDPSHTETDEPRATSRCGSRSGQYSEVDSVGSSAA